MSILERVARTAYPGVVNVNPALVEWKPVDGSPGNFIKVLHIDEPTNRVDFLFRQDPHCSFAKHVHQCQVATVTLDGEWGYREGDEKLFTGCYAYDAPGTMHTPYSTDRGMLVFATFQATSSIFLDYIDDDGAVTGHMDMDFFKAYYDA